MKIYLVILGFIAGIATVQQSPHGPKLKQDCSECHTSQDWKVDLNTVTFDHAKTGFDLKGQHRLINCKMCHSTLIFDEVKAKSRCIDCHNDVHQQTVGFDCAQCHNSSSWIIGNTLDLHRQSRFPLLGVHAVTDCKSCHASAPNLKFETLGVECYDCHKEKYVASTKPNHIEQGYSTYCIECHSARSYEWSASGFNHNTFPLTGGHKGPSCNDCHGEDSYTSISADCVDCHKSDFEQATNPKHDPVSFSTKCDECHTTDPDWKPAKFAQHDGEAFPIYSGSHRGEWKSCADCHENLNDYGSFTCISCHAHGKIAMDLQHREERDYEYKSSACFDCHPRGRAEDD